MPEGSTNESFVGSRFYDSFPIEYTIHTPKDEDGARTGFDETWTCTLVDPTIFGNPRSKDRDFTSIPSTFWSSSSPVTFGSLGGVGGRYIELLYYTLWDSKNNEGMRIALIWRSWRVGRSWVDIACTGQRPRDSRDMNEYLNALNQSGDWLPGSEIKNGMRYRGGADDLKSAGDREQLFRLLRTDRMVSVRMRPNLSRNVFTFSLFIDVEIRNP